MLIRADGLAQNAMTTLYITGNGFNTYGNKKACFSFSRPNDTWRNDTKVDASVDGHKDSKLDTTNRKRNAVGFCFDVIRFVRVSRNANDKTKEKG